jgi:hypothetical protein
MLTLLTVVVLVCGTVLLVVNMEGDDGPSCPDSYAGEIRRARGECG